MIMKKRFPSIGHLGIIIILFAIFQLPFMLPMKYLPEHKMLILLIAYVFSMTMTILATKKIFNRRAKLNFKPGFWYLLPVIIVVTFLFLMLGNILVALLPEPTGKLAEIYEKFQESMKLVMENKVLGFLMLAIAAPLLEEILFRGIILKALLKKYSPYKAILISAFTFGIFHLNPWQFLFASVLGLWLGYVYWKTRSLFYPVMIHFIVNATAFVLSLKYGENIADDPFEKNKDIQLYLTMLMILVSLIWLAYRYFEKYFSSKQRSIVLATQNSHKIAEIQKILPENFKLISLGDIGFDRKLQETGKSLKANALQKMQQVAVPYDVDVIADDTGLEVEALNGAPGVYSARYAGENATYEDNVQKLLSEMRGKENRNARFRTVVAMSLGNKEYVVEGEVKGKITTEPRGTNGFGYDSVFVPEGYDKTFAEMSDEEKNAISHRANALKKLNKILKS